MTRILDAAHALYLQVRGRSRPIHPFDRALGIETTRSANSRFIKTGDKRLDDASVSYVGATPSVIRKGLDAIGVTDDMAFVDLGCGKGRVLVVAAEYPFRHIVGIELLERLCAVARQNVSRLPRALRGERIAVLQGDASTPRLPDASCIVVFLYNPFRRPLVEALVAHLEAELSNDPSRRIWVIYYNPVCFDVFDASGAFVRYFAERIDFDPDEALAAPTGNTHDSVVIYQSVGANQRAPLFGAERTIDITVPDLGAEVRQD